MSLPCIRIDTRWLKTKARSIPSMRIQVVHLFFARNIFSMRIQGQKLRILLLSLRSHCPLFYVFKPRRLREQLAQPSCAREKLLRALVFAQPSLLGTFLTSFYSKFYVYKQKIQEGCWKSKIRLCRARIPSWFYVFKLRTLLAACAFLFQGIIAC